MVLDCVKQGINAVKGEANIADVKLLRFGLHDLSSKVRKTLPGCPAETLEQIRFLLGHLITE